jgi:hypothetical protein
MNCKNCGNIANETYCPNCAQSTKVERINLKSILSELSDSIFQVNRGFLFTIKELFTRPGHSIREYLEGKRRNHFKPIAFLFTLSTIYFLLSRYIDFDTILGYFAEGASAAVTDLSRKSADYEKSNGIVTTLNWLADNYAYTTLLLLPMYSLASYVSFLGLKFNYLEHVALNAYLSGQQTIIYIVFFTLFIFIDVYYIEALPILISMGYTFWVFRQFFIGLSLSSVVLRVILTYILYFIFTFGFIFVLLIVRRLF